MYKYKFELWYFNIPLRFYNDELAKIKWENVKEKKYFQEYTIIKPNYYYLKKKIMIDELIVEYLLACFIAFFVQIIITFTKRKKLDEK